MYYPKRRRDKYNPYYLWFDESINKYFILFDDNKIDKVVCDNQYKFLIPDKKYSLKDMNNKFARMECKH